MTKGGEGSYQKSAAKEGQKSEDSAPSKGRAAASKIMIDPMLIEVGLDSWKDLSTGRDAIQKYLQLEYGLISNIFPDSLKAISIGAYSKLESMDYRVNPIISPDQLDPEVDIYGINKQMVVDDLKKRSERNLKYEKDKISAYNTIRSVLSLTLDEILFSKEEFSKIPPNDPIALWDLVTATVMSRNKGTSREEKAQVLKDYHNFQQYGNELVNAYARRFRVIVDRMKFLAIDPLPEEAELAYKFTTGLNPVANPAMGAWQQELRNSIRVHGVDSYPQTLDRAVKAATEYGMFQKKDKAAGDSAASHLVLAASKTTTEDKSGPGRGKGRESGRGGRGGGGRGHVKTEDKEKGKPKEGYTCHLCGQTGHYIKDCPELAALQELKLKQGSPSHKTTVNYADRKDEADYYDQIGGGFGASINMMQANKSARCATDRPYQVILDTGANGNIMAYAEILTDIRTEDQPMTFIGLNGSVLVNKSGKLGDIGRTFLDTRLEVNILSMSYCGMLGHVVEFIRGETYTEQSAYLHTFESSYLFKSENELLVHDFRSPRVKRLAGAPPPYHQNMNLLRHVYVVTTIPMTSSRQLPTADANESA